MSGGRFFIETWGCQMNELDSQRLAGQLMQQGLLPTREAREAEVILLNSCSVREKAQQKAYSRLGEYRLLKRDNPRLLIGLCGCVAQQEGRRALDRVKDLDFVLGTGRVGELRALLQRVRSGERVVATGFPASRPFDPDAIARDGAYKGMVTIVEGCNQRCTFCVVPSTRGPERSRTLAEIVGEVSHLVDFGFREIELLGQTVNHWREPSRGYDFADLLDAVAALPGVERLRFVTSYPKHFSQRMIDRVARHPNICPYLHLPVQSGSDAVLRRMGRGYRVSEYRQLVAELRAARSGLSISTDIIVGFPGETEADFAASLDLVRDLRFGALFAFKYSARPQTAAPRLGPAVEEPIADQRLERLLGLQAEIQKSLNESLVGRTMAVLVTGWGKDSNLVGRTPCHRVVNFALREGASPGSIIPVRIERAFPHSLGGCAL